MKKAFVIGLVLSLVVAAVLVFTVTSSAAAGTPSTTVTVGSQVLKAGGMTKLTAGNGTVEFDPQTGTLTLNNATLSAGIVNMDGDLTIIATGDNTISVSSGFIVQQSKGALTFGGTGTLTMTSQGYGVYNSCNGGHLTVKDSLTLNISSKNPNYTFGTRYSCNIVFKDSCNVSLTGGGAGVLFQKTADGTQKVLIQDSASVVVNTENCNDTTSGTDARGAIFCSDLEVVSGSLTVNSKKNVMSAVDCKNFTQKGGAVTVSSTVASDETFNCTTFTQTGGTMTVTATKPTAVALKCTSLTQSGGKMEVTSSDTTAYAVNCTSFSQSNGSFSVTGENTNTDAMYCNGFTKTGGDMTVTTAGNSSKYKVQGVVVWGDDTTVATFSGGNFTANISSASPSATDLHAIYFHHVKKVDFCGTNLSLNVTTPKAGAYSSALLTGWSKEVSLSAGTITANLNANTTGLICPRYGGADFVLNVSGGTITGTAPSLLNTSIGTDGSGYTTSVAVNILDGAKISLKTPGGVLSPAKGYTVNTTGTTATFLDGCGIAYGNEYLITSNAFAPGEILTDVVIQDAKGTTTLNFGYRTYNGSVGQIRLDPEAKTLVFDGVVGPTAISVPGNATVAVIGTNRLNASSGPALTVLGNLILNGTGHLELTGASNLLKANEITVESGKLWLTASAGATIDVDSLTVTGTANVRGLAEEGQALTVKRLSLSQSANVQFYGDNGEGISVETVSVSGTARLTVDAAKTSLAVSEQLNLFGAARMVLYSQTECLSLNSASANLSGDSLLAVLEDAEGGKGMVMNSASLNLSDSAVLKTVVTGTGISGTGNISVTGGSASVDGIPAVASTLTVTSPYIMGGEGSWNCQSQSQINGTENYILLSATNPETPGANVGLGEYAKELMIHYVPRSPAQIVYSLDVTWENNDVAFDYSAGVQGTWKPLEHIFTGGDVPKWTDPDLNVEVVNHSNAAVLSQITVTDGNKDDDLVVTPDKEQFLLATAKDTSIADAPKTVYVLTITGTPEGAVENVATVTLFFSESN